jgi:hypothetical protein
MGIRKHNIIVVALSVAIAVSILISPCTKSQRSSSYNSLVYPVGQGWGYNITRKDTVFIHQESVPALEGNKPFITKEQAMEAARRVISKLEKGESPAFSRSEIELIMLAR